jgi:catechol 2,3-dioxygenase-like lactoylglutathione lyase family enzyme
MKRFHVHVAVSDLAASVRFYSTVFGQSPSVEKPDYAKWMLEDPRVNFAISHHDHAKAGLNHLGVQVETSDELAALREQLMVADAGLVTEENAACCYARSDKHWVTDPSGIAWESFHTLSTIPVFGDDTNMSAVTPEVCCTPELKANAESCCIPTPRQRANSKCCG